MVSVNLWHTLLVAAIVHETQQRQIWKWCWLSVYVYVRINYNKTMMRCQARLTVCTHNLLPLLIHWLWNKQTHTHTHTHTHYFPYSFTGFETNKQTHTHTQYG